MQRLEVSGAVRPPVWVATRQRVKTSVRTSQRTQPTLQRESYEKRTQIVVIFSAVK
jgi:hypothetical protein